MSTFTSDTMTDTAGVAITAHVGEVGATWTDGSGTSTANRSVITAAGRLRGAVSATTYWATASGVPANADQEATCDLFVADLTNTAAAGPALRIDTAAQTHYVGRHKTNVTPNLWEILKIVAGTQTSLGTFNETLTVGNTYNLDFTVTGSSLNLNVGGVTKVGPVTDAAITAANFAGFRLTQNGNPSDTVGLHLDNMVATSGLAETFDLLLLPGPTRVRFTN